MGSTNSVCLLHCFGMCVRTAGLWDTSSLSTDQLYFQADISLYWLICAVGFHGVGGAMLKCDSKVGTRDDRKLDVFLGRTPDT